MKIWTEKSNFTRLEFLTHVARCKKREENEFQKNKIDDLGSVVI